MAKPPDQSTKDRVAAIISSSRAHERHAQSGATYRAGGQASRRRLSAHDQAGADRVANRLDGSSAAAPSGGGGGGGILGSIEHVGASGLGDVLKAIDTARATVVSGYQEGLHGVRTATNAVGLTDPAHVDPTAAKQAANYAASVAQDAASDPSRGPMSQQQVQAVEVAWLDANHKRIHDERQQAKYLNQGPSWDQFTKGVSDHVGYGQVLDNIAGGSFTGNKLGDFALGTAGDIALDPLTHVLPGKLGTEEAIGSAQTALHAAQTAGDVQKVAQLEDVLTKLGRGKTVAALSEDQLGAIGREGEGGYRVFGKNVGGQDLRNTIYEHNPLSMARHGVGDILDKGGLIGRGKLNGGLAEFKAAARSGVAQEAVPALEGMRAFRAGKLLTGYTSAALREEGAAAIKDSGLTSDELLDAFHGMQGDAEALGRVGADRVKPLQDWYEKAAAQYEEATGKELPRLDDYVNRQITDEMAARVGKGKKGSLFSVVQDFAKHRDIGPGSELFGDVVPETATTPSAVLKWANAKSVEVFGHDMYKTDLAKLMDSYSQQVGNAVGVARRNTLLEQAGLRTQVPLVDQPLNETKIANATENVSKREASRAAAVDKLAGAQDQTVQAEQAVAARDSAQRGISGLEGKVDLSELDQAHDAARYHQEHADAMVPSTAANAPEVGTRITSHAEEAQAKLVKLTQKRGVTSHLANSYVDASVSYADAANWGRQAAEESDPLLANVAAMRAQENLLMGDMQQEGMRLDVARDKLTAASVPKQKLADLTQGALREQFGALNAIDTDPHIVRLIDSTMELTKPHEMNKFLENYDKVLNWVKAWEITSPRFLSHITLGHAWNNALARIEMGSYSDFFAADRAFGDEAKWATFAEKNPDVADAYTQVRNMVDGGAHDFGSVEAGTSSGESFRNATINPFSNENKAFYAVRKLGGDIQRLMRTSLGMDTILRKGGTIDDAIEKIAMYHFDYSDLSGFERDFVKRVIPFYTWTRRNLPLQLEMLAKRPSVYSKYTAVTRNLTAVASPDPGANLLPSYFGEQGAFLTPFKDSGNAVYGSAAMTPLKELQENPLDPRTWLSQVTPIIKAPLEVWAGKQVYKDLPITEGQVPLPGELKPFASLLQGIGVSKTDKDGNVTVSGKAAYLLEQAIPSLAVAQRLPGGGKTSGRGATNLVNWLLGTGALVNTPQAQKSEKFHRQDVAQAAKDKAEGKTATITLHYKPKQGSSFGGVANTRAERAGEKAERSFTKPEHKPKPFPDLVSPTGKPVFPTGHVNVPHGAKRPLTAFNTHADAVWKPALRSLQKRHPEGDVTVKFAPHGVVWFVLPNGKPVLYRPPVSKA